MNTGRDPCQNCPSNSVPRLNGYYCESCPAGFEPSSGSFGCSPCPVGTFKEKEGNKACDLCKSSDKAYMMLKGSKKCIKSG